MSTEAILNLNGLTEEAIEMIEEALILLLDLIEDEDNEKALDIIQEFDNY